MCIYGDADLPEQPMIKMWACVCVSVRVSVSIYDGLVARAIEYVFLE